jgi:hypothetical protein
VVYRTPKDLAGSLARRRKTAAADDGYVRATFTAPREEARATARQFLNDYPKALMGPKWNGGRSCRTVRSSSG